MSRRAPLLLTLLLLHSSYAGAQGVWKVGPFDNGSAPNGASPALVTGAVRAATTWDPDGAGPKTPALMIGGDFTSMEGQTSAHVTYRDPDTHLWQNMFGLSLGPIEALSVFGGQPVIGCAVSNVNKPLIMRWNGSSWQSLISTTQAYVNDFAVYNGALYAGGFFTMPGGAVNVARYNAGSGNWDSVGWPGLPNEDVEAFGQYAGALIVGTSYSDSNPHGRVWSYDGSWHLLAECNGRVSGFTLYNGYLVAAGAFDIIGNASYGHIALWNGSAWLGIGGTDSYINKVTTYHGAIIAGGTFSTAGGNAAANITMYDGNWKPLGFGIDGPVSMLQVADDELIAGGQFANAGAEPASNIARWNGQSWSPFGGGSVLSVRAMAPFAGRLAVAGNFHQSSTTPPSHEIAAWDGISLVPYGIGFDDQVNALESFKYPGIHGDYELLAGGFFTHAGGIAANRIARWDVDPFVVIPPPAWQAMGPGFNDAVFAIKRFNGTTYAGGIFTASGATAVNRIAKYNASTNAWEPLGTGTNGPVYALQTFGNNLYAGGSFTSAGGVATGGLARWDGASWSMVGGTFAGTVYALTVHNGALVIGGSYPGINSSPNLAYFDGVSYGTFGTGGTAGGAVQALCSTGTRLYVGGAFSAAGNLTASHLAYWDGAWHAITDTPDNTVFALGVLGPEINVGGAFATAGTHNTPGWGRYAPANLPWFAYPPASVNTTSGSSVSFTAIPASGYEPLSLRWYHYGTPLTDNVAIRNGEAASHVSGATSQTLTLTGVGRLDAGPYTLVATGANGSDTSSAGVLTVDGVSAVPEPGTPTDHFEGLSPNPTRGPTAIELSLAREADVTVRVLDIAGREVRRSDLGRVAAGRRTLTWDARDERRGALRPGLYLVRVDAGSNSLGTRRMVVAR